MRIPVSLEPFDLTKNPEFVTVINRGASTISTKIATPQKVAKTKGQAHSPFHISRDKPHESSAATAAIKSVFGISNIQKAWGYLTSPTYLLTTNDRRSSHIVTPSIFTRVVNFGEQMTLGYLKLAGWAATSTLVAARTILNTTPYIEACAGATSLPEEALCVFNESKKSVYQLHKEYLSPAMQKSTQAVIDFYKSHQDKAPALIAVAGACGLLLSALSDFSEKTVKGVEFCYQPETNKLESREVRITHGPWLSGFVKGALKSGAAGLLLLAVVEPNFCKGLGVGQWLNCK